MWIAGLRGAMAYALGMKSLNDLPLGPIILITTLVYAFISILVIGSILNPIMRCFDVKRKDSDLSESQEIVEIREHLDCCTSLKRAI